jgi:hypothetical protein
MIMRLKVSTLRLFQDALVGTRMFFKGKINPIPHGIENREEVRKIFEETIDKKR